MTVCVVDASALAALLFGEASGDDVARRLEGARLAAPGLLRYELASVCLKKRARHPDLKDALFEALRLAEAMDIEIVDVSTTALVELAETSGLTAYDAAYLWLAQLFGGELMTLDRRLGAAARTLGISTR
ncbi:MAG: type II toxin-antitoxin system VapC family toxin [Myxococcota bacterium]